MTMGSRYTDPDAAGCLLEADACKKVEAELRRLADKYQRKIDRERAARETEFEAAMQYRSENELLDAYGWEVITEKQYELYLDLFRRGREALENHAPTVNEAADRILLRILSDIAAEQREWRFSALTPAQQAAEIERAEKAKQEWREKLRRIREDLDLAAKPEEPCRE